LGGSETKEQRQREVCQCFWMIPTAKLVRGATLAARTGVGEVPEIAVMTEKIKTMEKGPAILNQCRVSVSQEKGYCGLNGGL